MDRLHEEQLPDFTRQADREDYEDQLIEFSMCAGNLLARHNCLVEGSFGYGTAFYPSDVRKEAGPAVRDRRESI